MQTRTHKVEGGYVLSIESVWCPGVYESVAAAELAAKMDVDVIQQLWESVLPGSITESMLVELAS